MISIPNDNFLYVRTDRNNLNTFFFALYIHFIVEVDKTNVNFPPYDNLVFFLICILRRMDCSEKNIYTVTIFIS
jgi:hypothetical protein